MKKEIESRILDVLHLMGRYPGYFDGLSSMDLAYANDNPQDAVRLFVSALRNRGQDDILKYLGTVSIPVFSEEFFVKADFVVNTDVNAVIKIFGMGEDFRRWFLAKEEKCQPLAVDYYDSLKMSNNNSIVGRFGSMEEMVTTLAAIFQMMYKQQHEKCDLLLESSLANKFYVPDIDGTLREIVLRWWGIGWYLNAYQIEYPLECAIGDRIFVKSLSLIK